MTQLEKLLEMKFIVTIKLIDQKPQMILAPQFEYIRKSVLAFNLPSVDLPNYEADDLIATYVEQILKRVQKLQ